MSKAVIHNIVILFVIHNIVTLFVIHNVIINGPYNAKLWPFVINNSLIVTFCHS